MIYLSWFSILALLVLMGLYLYWSWREERARPQWVRNSFYGGIAFFSLLFLGFTWHTVSVVPERTGAQALTAEVVAGKHVWHKYVCIDCHTLLGNGAYYAPELGTAWNRFLQRAGGDEKAARATMAAFLRNPPRATADRRGMPDVGMSAEEAAQLTAFLQWTSRIDTNGWPPEPARPIRPAVLPAGKALPPEAQRGKQLFSESGCVGCHSVGGGAVVGPDLSGVAARYDRATVVRWIRDPESIYRERRRKPLNAGYPEMPGFEVGEPEALAIATYLMAAGGKE